MNSKTGRILKGSKAKNGYLHVPLRKDKIQYSNSVHRLIAETFIPNPENKPCIDHIDGNRYNNSVYNLRWCTQKENCNNPISRKRYSEAQKGRITTEETRKKMSESHKGKPVICYNNYGVIKIYLSLTDVEKDGFSKGAVCSCCNGKKYKSHHGCQFRYATDEDITYYRKTRINNKERKDILFI